MKFGVTMFQADFAMNVVELGRAVEARGFESFFLPEHMGIPTRRVTPWPQGGDYAAAIQRVIELGDEWMPHPDRGDRPLGQRISEFWEQSEAAGRGKLPVTVFGSRADPRLVEEYQSAGVDRCVFRLPPAG